MSLFNYACDEVDVLVAGFIPVQGFIDGTFVSISKDSLPFTARRAPDGSVARVHHRDQTYTIKITLHNASSSNDMFTRIWLLDEATQTGKFPLLIKDQSGSDLFFSTSTWVEEVPNMDKSTSVDSRTWTLRSAHAVINIGNNEEPSSLLEDIFTTVVGSIPGFQNTL